ncbi:SSI family serine proteinase inhibitor [Streptomyces hydrogenans]|uniref:SSI family serine proteinase inhibitor n=1 Tax=Streptomyces hydrogenans TaxID=1873719 RepID=UPI0035DDC4CC
MNMHAPAALLAALLLAAPAVDAFPSPEPVAGTALRLTVTGPAPTATALSPDGVAPAAPAARTVTLRCDPAGGEHPRAAAACDDLDASAGRVERAPDDTACVLLYDPVEVRAEGVWRGRPVSFSRTYGNTCELHVRTGAVFAF